ncbi:putative FAD-dependent dehydrogenase [Desulfohalotomaculum tongense]|uniref:NAD(P)/FAD-dependent oxidoreductase n=1 Tax=Desulforadius tongensis TaxID=1216062 RepID=UPI001959D216|nr:NAD(P)/FAD-dependent oxidoreductase [Desulforadius tongensis]MBM7855524.1 putative FAD-dependent dehydrogenase [Desulforadius tongensis]
MIRVSQIKLPIDHNTADIVTAVLKKLRIKKDDLLEYRIYKQSIDARKKDKIYFVYTVDVRLKKEKNILDKIKSKDISVTPNLKYKYVQHGFSKLEHRPVIVGTGPAGLFCGLILAQMGYRPLLLERGADVDTRTERVQKFWQTGQLDTGCNVQFGEGGAGTFSDGKLTTMIKNKRCRKVLEELVQAGAPEEIMYAYKPHIGTDILKTVVKNIRQRIIELGGEVRFNSRVSSIIVEDGRVSAVAVNGSEKINTQVLVLAIGHSARDTFEMLYQKGIVMVPKPFSIGVRIEHPQDLINRAQYKQFANHPRLGAADYKLSYHSGSGRSAYTFCMCPGGLVVAAASEKEGVVTNGMSEYARDAENANSALLVGVKPDDYGSDHPLTGVYFQRRWERKAYELGGGNYRAPAQLVGDFLLDRPSSALGSVQPSYKPGVELAELKNCLPGYVIETLKEAITAFDRKIKGFAMADAVLTGVETRSSSPVRIYRDENLETNIGGIYPAGEGPGYAGGIMSAAVDGIQVAESIAGKYSPEPAS